MDEPRTHYQISVTARQAVGLFVGLLLSLGLAFFFGLMAGLSGSGRARAAAARTPPPVSMASSETLPPIETAVPIASARVAAGDSRDAGAPSSAAEPTVPPVVQTFEDGNADDTAAPPRAVATPAGRPAAAPRSPAPSGHVWVQVASVSSRSEADAMAARLTRRGYRSQLVVDSSAKGRIRVRVGPFRTTEDARRIAEKLRRQEKIKSPWVVTEAK